MESGDLIRDLTVDGQVSPTSAPTLYAPSAGIVTFRVHAGDVVAQDAVVAVIDSPELQNKFAQEQATLASAEVDYRRARIASDKQRITNEDNYQRAEINLRTARREYDRSKRAFDVGAYSEIALLRAKDQLEQAEFAMNVAQKNKELDLQALTFDLESKKLATERQRLLVSELRRQVDALTVRSLVAGSVGQLFVADRASIAQGAALLAIVDLSRLELDVKMPESFARDLSLGQHAEISTGSGSWRGEVAAVSPQVVQGEVAARVRFAGTIPKGLRANQRLSVRILLDERKNVLIVDRGPWVEASGGQFAYVIQDSVAERRPVELGAMSLSKVEIVSGLKPGDQIVVSGMEGFDRAERIILSR